MKDTILEAAERRVRTRGYHGFSFRDIAQDVGIKSSSVHYHFPTKADLVMATAQRYSDRFFAALGEPLDARTSEDKLEALRQSFRRAMTHDEMMCLCGVLASERAGVPDEVDAVVKAFFTRMHAWVDGVLSTPHAPASSAWGVLATLEGALLMARTYDDVAIFDEATRAL